MVATQIKDTPMVGTQTEGIKMADIKTADTSMVAIKMVDTRMADTTKMVASQEMTDVDTTMMAGTTLRMDDMLMVDFKIVASMASDDLLPLMRVKRRVR